MPPEVEAILEQVRAALLALMASGDTGRVIVHCAESQMVVEVETKRKHEPVRLERARMNVIRRPR